MRNFREQWECDSIFVAVDEVARRVAALYSAENIQSLTNLKWISRVPATIKEAEQLMEYLSIDALQDSSLEGYRIACVCSTYGGIQQRWLSRRKSS